MSLVDMVSSHLFNDSTKQAIIDGLNDRIDIPIINEMTEEKVLTAISQGASGSWQMENRYKTMNLGDYNHGFAVDWMRKDLGIALNEGRERGAHLPVTALVDQFYSEIQSMGGKRWDTSSLLERLEERRGKN